VSTLRVPSSSVLTSAGECARYATERAKVRLESRRRCGTFASGSAAASIDAMALARHGAGPAWRWPGMALARHGAGPAWRLLLFLQMKYSSLDDYLVRCDELQRRLRQ
jgi:hypothetical protein